LSVAAAHAADAQTQAPPLGVVAIDPASEAARHIKLAAAGRWALAGKIAATANEEPDADTVAQITTRVPGRVVKLIAAAGDAVKPGQPLVILSSLELGDAKVEYLKARSLEAIAVQNLEREQGLYEKQISALKDVLAARAAHDSALAQYDAAREVVQLFQSDAVGRIQESFGLIEGSYRSGKTGLIELIVAENDLVNTDSSYLDSLWDYQAARIGIEAAVGADFATLVKQ
jgi:multidrug efflux pump subunit AcrA (membrane-fusion protein)